MQQAKTGDSVHIHYTGKLTNGEQFDSSEGREPLNFTLGSGMVIKGFDEGVTGMVVGDKKTVNIPAKNAYGDVNPEMIMEFPKSNMPPDMVVTQGQQLVMNSGDGQQIPVTVVAVNEQTLTIDANHHLAGKELIFDLELVKIDAQKSSIILEP